MPSTPMRIKAFISFFSLMVNGWTSRHRVWTASTSAASRSNFDGPIPRAYVLTSARLARIDSLISVSD